MGQDRIPLQTSLHEHFSGCEFPVDRATIGRVVIEIQSQLGSRAFDAGNIVVQHVIPLELLGAGEQGCIFDVEGDQDLVVRLKEMGLCQGVQVRMVQPGCPCIVAVNNHRLSFRGDDAAVVLVEPSL